ncbi:MAG: 50S ribosomal protein L25 [Leptospirales bacterium]
MEKIVLKAEPRKAGQRAALCRKEGNIPAVMYNHGKTDLLKINAKDVQKLIAAGISESQLYSVEIGDKSEEAFIKDYQVHPVSQEVLHMDFFRITYGEKVRTHIPIHLVGSSIGVKEGGVLEVFAHDIEIEILPKNLTAAISIDISELQLGDAMHAEDLTLPEGAKVLAEGNPIICHITTPTRGKIDDEEAVTEEETPEGTEPKDETSGE